MCPFRRLNRQRPPRPAARQVHDLREGRREAEDRLAWAMEHLAAARQLLADRGVEFQIDPAAAFGAGEDEEVSEGGGGGGGRSGLQRAGPARGAPRSATAGSGGALGEGGGGGGGGGPREGGPADSARSLGQQWDGDTWGPGQPRRSASNWSESAAEGGHEHQQQQQN